MGRSNLRHVIFLFPSSFPDHFEDDRNGPESQLAPSRSGWREGERAALVSAGNNEAGQGGPTDPASDPRPHCQRRETCHLPYQLATALLPQPSNTSALPWILILVSPLTGYGTSGKNLP